MNAESVPPEIPSSRAEPLRESKETAFNRIAACSRLGRLLLMSTFVGTGLSFFVYSVWSTGGDSGAAREQAEKHQTKVTMRAIQVAVEYFRTEYRRLPLPASQHERKVDVTVKSRGRWLDALIANEPDLNRRSLKFLDVPLVGEKGGLKWENRETVLVDRWGNPFTVIFDANFDNLIANPEPAEKDSGKETPEHVKGSILLYSGGPDGNPATWDDNICSWR